MTWSRKTPNATRLSFITSMDCGRLWGWEDVEPEEHAVAFTIAKAMAFDLLDAMRGEMQKALRACPSMRSRKAGARTRSWPIDGASAIWSIR